jgi:23S rRNA pseudouridine2605 synthase
MNKPGRRGPEQARSKIQPKGTSERLQKILANAGVASRRAAEEIITSGRVRVNGEVITQLGVRADPASDRIEVDGKPLTTNPSAQASQQLVYIALNKPTGVVSTARDTHGRKTVLDLLDGAKLAERGLRLYPVGRLDADTTGLLLITNDGDLTFRLTHPRYGVEKEYRALVRGHPDEATLKRLRDGVEVEGEKTAPARIDVLGRQSTATWLRVVIHEGRKRQVRLMAAAVGHPVADLQRIRFGPLLLGKLEPGKWRYLAVHEVHALRKAVRLGTTDDRRRTADGRRR